MSRDVPVGPVFAELSGTAINETAEDFPGAENLKVQVATVEREESNSSSVVFNINSTIYSLNGHNMLMDVSTFEKEGRVFVPIRYLLNSLGADNKNITYDNNQLVITHKGIKLELEIGSKILKINGKVKEMDVSPLVVNERAMLPARYAAEALGGEVAYELGKVVINLN